MPRPTRVALAVVLALFSTGLRVAAQTSPGWAEVAAPVTLLPIGDASVIGDQKHANFGRDDKLEVDEKPRSQSYLRFVVPVGLSGPVVLRLWVLDPTKDGPRVRRYDGTLDETAVTWKNRVTPLSGTAVNTGALKKGSWAEWDVTGLVAGAGDMTLALVADAADGVEFGSRESDHSPELVFKGSPNTTTTTTTVPGTPPACRPDWDQAARLGRLASGLSEMSGFVASPVHRSWAWGIRDSGNPASLYAIQPTSSGEVATQELRAYGLDNSDWEDLAYTPGFEPGTGHLWVLENVGNNWTGNRWIYQFEELDPENPPPPPPTTTTTTTTTSTTTTTTTTTPPDPDAPPEESTTTSTVPPPPPAPPPPPPPPATLVGAYRWAYPDVQANTETMFVFDGDFVVVTKSEPSRVYRFDGPLLPFTVNVPTYVGTLPAGKLLSIAALSVDQRTLAFSNHGKLDVYENRGDVRDLAALLSNPVFHQDMASDNREGGAFFPYGSCDLMLLAESKAIWRLEHR